MYLGTHTTFVVKQSSKQDNIKYKNTTRPSSLIGYTHCVLMVLSKLFSLDHCRNKILCPRNLGGGGGCTITFMVRAKNGQNNLSSKIVMVDDQQKI